MAWQPIAAKHTSRRPTSCRAGVGGAATPRRADDLVASVSVGSSRWTRVGGLGLLLMASTATGVRAQPPADAPASAHDDPAATPPTGGDASQADAEAREHFRLGREHHAAGRFEEAAAEFEAAYALSRRPQLLYNIFVARRDGGQMRPAADALRRYLEEVPDVPEREQLTVRLQRMEEMIAREEAAAREAADDRPDGRDGERGASPRRDDGGGALVGWIVAGAGGVAIAVSIVTGVLALDRESELESTCDADHFCDPGFEETRDSGRTLATVTDVLWVGGSLVAAGGVVLALVLGGGSDDEPEPEPAERATVSCGPSGCIGRMTLWF